jgi:hypothetical protein
VASRAGVPGPSSGAVTDLDERSPLVRELRRTPLPSGVSMTTVGAVGDFVATADRTAVRGATHVVVDPEGIRDHTEIVDDPEAVAAVKLALAGLPPPCTSLVSSVRGRVQPLLIRRAIALTDEVVKGPMP